MAQVEKSIGCQNEECSRKVQNKQKWAKKIGKGSELADKKMKGKMHALSSTQ